MAHLFINLRDQGMPVFFNVDGVVGASPAQNNREDVLLVQFFLKLAADNLHTEMLSPADIALVRSIAVTGTSDQTTINVISLSQRLRKIQTPAVIADGRVSPARGGETYRKDSYYTIVTLNDRAHGLAKDVWPRIDKIPGCPPELKQMVARTLAGI